MSDTAEYSAVATNQYGTATSRATVTVKSKSSSSSSLAVQTLLAATLSVPGHGFLFLAGPSGTGESCHLGLGEDRREQLLEVWQEVGVFFIFWLESGPDQFNHTRPSWPQIAGHVRGLIRDYCEKLLFLSRVGGRGFFPLLTLYC